MLTFVTLTNNELIMKKVLFSLIALMAVMTVQAQSICGTWRSMQPIIETAEDGSLEIQNLTCTFNEDGTYSFIDELTMSTEPAPTMALEIATSIDIKGTYTLEGDKLTLTPDIDTYKYEILSISVNGQVGANPMIKSQINAIFKSPEFKEQFAAVQENTVKVGDASLEMTNEGTTVNFVRFATIEN